MDLDAASFETKNEVVKKLLKGVEELRTYAVERFCCPLRFTMITSKRKPIVCESHPLADGEI